MLKYTIFIMCFQIGSLTFGSDIIIHYRLSDKGSVEIFYNETKLVSENSYNLLLKKISDSGSDEIHLAFHSVDSLVVYIDELERLKSFNFKRISIMHLPSGIQYIVIFDDSSGDEENIEMSPELESLNTFKLTP